MDLTMIKSEACFNSARTHRYYLQRSWDFDRPAMAFVCLNPSTADEYTNDPTVTRCINFANGWGYGTFYMLNLFAFRATDPKDMKAAADPVGKLNDSWIKGITDECHLTVAAWGNHGAYLGRDKEVRKLFNNLYCLKITKSNQPYHPLYLRADLQPFLLP